MCSSLIQLAPGSGDSSQAEKGINVEQIQSVQKIILANSLRGLPTHVCWFLSMYV